MGMTAPGFQNEQLEMAYYLELQRRVIDIFRYVSCNETNFKTYSVIIESVLVDAGSFFDSQCQTLIRDFASKRKFTEESKVRDFKRKSEGKDNFNFRDYRILLESEFILSTKSVNLNRYDDAFFANPTRHAPDQMNGFLVSPFGNWSRADTSSPWWAAFTNLKHDRLSTFRDATLGAVVSTMAAVFIVLTLHNEAAFKQGRVEPAIYDLFIPKYWKREGTLFPGIFTWK
jgi:hypothetical protein